MKPKGQENILPLQSLELRSKDGFGKRKGVTNVQDAIHVGIRKGDKEGFLLIRVGGIAFKDPRRLPRGLHRRFVGPEKVALGSPAMGHWIVTHVGIF
jgi:hypothetical protein